VTKHFLLIIALLFASGCISQGARQQVPLWMAGAPGSQGQTSPEVVGVQHEPSTQYVDGFSFAIVSNVNNPSITPFVPAAGTGTGAAVVVVPGGGHKFLAIEHEGYAVARVLAEHGVAAFVLKYRLAKAPNSPYKIEVHELMDVQRAIRTVRAGAKDWGVDPHRVGVMGFSAGGQLAMLAATRFGKPVPGSDDEIDQLSCRPDFVAMLYPGGLSDPAGMTIPAGMPPEFLACAYNDKPTISVTLAQLYAKLKQAGVPAELHIYNSGGHGFGVRPDSNKPVQGWTDLFLKWLGEVAR